MLVRVFLTVTKRCRRCRAMNIPSFGRKKAKKNLRGKGGRKVNPRTYKGGGEASPPDVFLRFSLDGQTSAPDVFSRCSFFTDAHFETVFVIISYSCYEIWHHWSSRWSSHFWVKMHVFQLLSTIKVNLGNEMKQSTYLCVLFYKSSKIQDGDHVW